MKLFYTLGLVLLFFVGTAQSFVMNENKAKASDFKVENISSNEILVDLNVNRFRLEEKTIEGVSYHFIQAGDLTPQYRKGTPDIRKQSLSVQIPNTEWLNDYEIVEEEYTSYANINLAPSRGLLFRSEEDTKPYVKGAVYNQNQFFPEQMVSISDPFIFRNTRGESVSLYPFQYNPVSKELRVYTHLKVKLKSKGEKGINPLLKVQKEEDREFVQLYDRLYANSNSMRYTQVGENGNLLIIAHPDFYEHMGDFVNWKRQRGIKTELLNLSDVGTTAQAIKTYIHNYYNTHNLRYVILVGDNTHIPSLSSNGDSDQAYAYVSGDDHYPEFFIGRFSVENLADLNTIKGKSIWYEKDVTTADTWLGKATGIASNEGSSGSGDDNESDQQHMDNIRTQLLAYGYTQVDEAYQNNSINTSTLASYVNEGRGLMNYVGHGSDDSWVTSGFNIEAVNNLNNYNKLPFIFDVACVNGNFHNQTCFAESWSRANSESGYTGAVAIIASTVNQPWAPPMDAQDEMVDILLDSYSDNVKRTFGGVTCHGIMHMLDEYTSNQGALTADTWTIFGDPSLQLRTKTPMVLNVTHSNTIMMGQSNLVVNSAVEGALVAVSYTNAEGEVVLVNTASVTGGQATVDISSILTPTTLTVTATAFNYIPSVTQANVQVASGPYLAMTGFTLSDADANNNQKLDYGESMKLNFKVKNVGVALSENAVVNIACTHPKITLVDSNENYGNLAADAEITKDNAFQFNLSNDIEDQTVIPFTYTITDQANTYNGQFSIVANAPKLKLKYLSILDDEGNGNGYMEANENFKLKAEISNIGHAAITAAAQISIASNNSHLSFSNSPIELSSLAAEGTQAVDFEGHLDDVTERSLIEITLSAASGVYQADDNISLPINLSIETWESDNFDTYEWSNSTSKPWTIVSDVVHQGTHALKSGHLTGEGETSISLTFTLTAADSLSFYKKVSCEDSGYETYMYDYLSFKINGAEKGRWDGEVDWSKETYALNTGNNTLKWTYKKDNYKNEGSDCAWIDDIVLPINPVGTSIECLYKSGNSNTAYRVYPNPAKDQIKISYHLEEAAKISVAIYSVSGTLQKSIVNHYQEQGDYHLQVNQLNLPAGIYFVQLNNGKKTEIKKLVICK